MEEPHNVDPAYRADAAGETTHPAPTTGKRLYRSSDKRMLLGVCGGLAEYFEIDPTLVRVAFIVVALFGGGGILLYVVLALVMPSEETLESHPRAAARATVDEAVQETRRAATGAGSWVKDKTSRWTSSGGANA